MFYVNFSHTSKTPAIVHCATFTIQSQMVGFKLFNYIKFECLEHFPNCNVHEYFSCVVNIKKWGDEGGFATYECNTPCEQIDYIAWQDMNELPGNIFPKIMEIDSSFDQNQELSSESDDEEEDVKICGLLT